VFLHCCRTALKTFRDKDSSERTEFKNQRQDSSLFTERTLEVIPFQYLDCQILQNFRLKVDTTAKLNWEFYFKSNPMASNLPTLILEMIRYVLVNLCV